MSRPSRSERLALSKGRPKRRAARTHFFKYQLATNPSRVEENDLKRALQESLLEEQASITNGGFTPEAKGASKTKINKNNHNNNRSNHNNTNNSSSNINNNRVINSSTNSSDVSKSSNISSSTSLESNGTPLLSTKRTRSSALLDTTTITPPSCKRAKLTNNSKHKQTNKQNNIKKKCDNEPSVLSEPPTVRPHLSKQIRTYSRSQPSLNGQGQQQQQQSSKQQQKQNSDPKPRSSTPILKTPSSIDGKLNGTPMKKEGQLYVSKSTQTSAPEISIIDPNNDGQICKKRTTQGSWSLLGVPEEKVIYLRDDESPKRLICYPAIKHVEGDVIQVKDSVLLRSGAKKTDLPYIAKVCAFWEDAETGCVMMSLFWYYRPEHTEEGRKPHHLPDEIFASRHRDVDSVECIEDKCYVLTFNEYCRYKKRCKMEQVNTTWSLADVTIPVSNESYPRRNRIPDFNVNPELVFCCRQIYDSRMRRLIKNPLINTKYGHI